MAVADTTTWVSNMLTYGKKAADIIVAARDAADNNAGLAAVYYDSARVFYQIADYTSQPSWATAAEAACYIYGTRYLIPADGAAQGYRKFPHGLWQHYKRTQSADALKALTLLCANGAYNRDVTPAYYTRDSERSREVAYGISCMIYQRKLMNTSPPRLLFLVEQALSHCEQWLNHTAAFCQPFMVGLTAEALIEYDAAVGGEPAILSTLKRLAAMLWSEFWLSDSNAFQYADRTIVLSDGNGLNSKPAVDLNMLIAPLFGWLYSKTGDESYKLQGNTIFNGGHAAYLAGGKQFNQNYRWSFDYLKWTGQTPTAMPVPQSAV